MHDYPFQKTYTSDFHKKAGQEYRRGNKDKSPEELLEDAFTEINNSLADDLMTEIMRLSATDFEHLVVHLLMNMGYGSGIDDAGMVTKAINDGGIDGIIKEDQLGFSSIYIQAKQWDPSRTVDRSSIDTFIGALTRNHAHKGLFITTAFFQVVLRPQQRQPILSLWMEGCLPN